jgi:hypothetical protein
MDVIDAERGSAPVPEGGGHPEGELRNWFLEPEERGNPATRIRPWTVGNRVEALIHGGSYFPRLYRELEALKPGDLVELTDWRGACCGARTRAGRTSTRSPTSISAPR